MLSPSQHRDNSEERSLLRRDNFALAATHRRHLRQRLLVARFRQLITRRDFAPVKEIHF